MQHLIQHHLIGEEAQSHAEFAERQLDFGYFVVGAEITEVAILINTGKIDTLYFIEPNSNFMVATSSSRVIPVNGYAGIAVTITANSNQQISSMITVSLRGNKQVQLQVIDEALEQNVELVEQNKDFESVIVGNQKKIIITFNNISVKSTVLYCDLTENTKFAFQKRDKRKEKDGEHQRKILGNFCFSGYNSRMHSSRHIHV
ncbi:MAG: hypothetical protein EZS28_035507 [Streblomastix strix]|uniref:HYDIN/VesB/CFA65-like Ig-like domain-containing protein n=1 Tax=Streblomastix strix TaxID=222440 RepID=A0A5J4UDT9_9EUKA|nr:MAG: hypothetical protein EZS28_035507 [Streblomastix strix]